MINIEKNGIKNKYKAYLNLNEKNIVNIVDILETKTLVIFLMEPIQGHLVQLGTLYKKTYFKDDEKRSKLIGKITSVLKALSNKGLHHGALSGG